MKSTLLFSIALIALLFTSCQKSEPVVNEGITEIDFSDVNDLTNQSDYHFSFPENASPQEISEFVRVENEKLQSRLVVKDGIVWDSEERYQKSKTQRAQPHYLRVETNDMNQNSTALVQVLVNNVWQALGWVQTASVTTGLPFAGDECSGDYLRVSVIVFPYPSNRTCMGLRATYLVGSSSMDIDDFGCKKGDNGYWLINEARCKNGSQTTPSELAIRHGNCNGQYFWLCSDY